MNRADVTGPRKPRRSTTQGNCVTVGQAAGLIAVFDSRQDETRPVLEITAAAWASFLATVR